MEPKSQRHYPSELNESQIELLNRYLPHPKSGAGKSGRPALERAVLFNAIMYVVKTGCQWRQLPCEYGAWQTVYGYFNRWSKLEVWRGLLEELTRLERKREGRHPQPTAASIDSQSIKTDRQSKDVGFDGGKKVKGRKRHVLTDTLGIILGVVVTAANINDRVGLKRLLEKWFIKGISRLRKIWVDAGYNGEEIKVWVAALKKTHRIDLEVVDHDGQGFQLVPKRWVVERVFAWLFQYRRHSKDYEVLTAHSEAMIQITMCSILVRRLA